MWGWGTYLFFQLKGSSTTSTHLSLTCTNIFPTPKEQKSDFLIKLNHQATNQTPSFSKLLNKRTFNKIQTLPKINLQFNYWNYIKQRKTVSTTLSSPQEMTFAGIIHSDPTTLSIFINPSNPMMFSRIKLLLIVLILKLFFFSFVNPVPIKKIKKKKELYFQNMQYILL